jgi:serine/threonine protein phosphatase PrpC
VPLPATKPSFSLPPVANVYVAPELTVRNADFFSIGDRDTDITSDLDGRWAACCATSNAGVAGRAQNQDAGFVDRGSELVMVGVDGMAGYEGGDLCAEVVTESLYKGRHSREALLKAANNLPREIDMRWQAMGAPSGYRSMGAAYGAVSINEIDATMLAITQGDVRVLVVSRSGEVVWESTLHADPRDRHVLLNCVGRDYDKTKIPMVNHGTFTSGRELTPDGYIPLREGDMIILDSDGSNHNLSGDEKGRLVAEHWLPNRFVSAVRTLLGEKCAANVSGFKHDNLFLAACRFMGATAPPIPQL